MTIKEEMNKLIKTLDKTSNRLVCEGEYSYADCIERSVYNQEVFAGFDKIVAKYQNSYDGPKITFSEATKFRFKMGVDSKIQVNPNEFKTYFPHSNQIQLIDKNPDPSDKNVTKYTFEVTFPQPRTNEAYKPQLQQPAPAQAAPAPAPAPAQAAPAPAPVARYSVDTKFGY